MSELKRLGLEQAHSMWTAGDAKVVDIRDAQSFAIGHIPGAFHLTDATLTDLLQSIDDDDAPLIVVCYHGISSQGAAQYLSQQGLTDVSSMDGGFTAWAHHYPDAVEHS